jgi:para-aminobenzoate synthetase component 1
VPVDVEPLPFALPPHRLVEGLSGVATLCALEAGGPEGWGSPPGGRGAGVHLIGVCPEVEFAGGIEALEEARRWLSPHASRDPFEAVLIGSLSYDLVRAFVPLPSAAAEEVPAPLVRLVGYRAVYRATSGRGEVVGSDPAALRATASAVRAAARQSHAPAIVHASARSRWPDGAFLAAVRRAQHWIGAGDVYQVNLARRVDFDGVPALALAGLWAALTRRAPAPFGAFLRGDGLALLGNSPERFLRVAAAQVETCPIKGTRPRGATPELDRRRARELLGSPKDRAEHVMIVDLERNDLGRVCRTGSVCVDRLGELRSFSTVHHLVSSVRGELRPGVRWLELLEATFPSGSISGAPKRRALEIIEALEPVRRGPYTGALGWFDAAGGIDLAIAIRTAVAARGRLHLHLGGGIVADSDPDAELAETRDKGRAFAELLGCAT